MLLANAGIQFEAVPADIDERAVQKNSGLSRRPARSPVCWRAKRRCRCRRRNPGRYVDRRRSDAGAGQSGCSASRRARAQAAEQLRALAGNTHELHSAVAVARDGKIVFADVSIAKMTMRQSERKRDIEAYLDAAGEAVTTSVGAYQLEGLGVHLFERIEGDHFTILGLPLLPLLAFLRSERLLGI